MPITQLSQKDIILFECQFKQNVELITQKTCDTVKDAYNKFLTISELQKKNFWTTISENVGLTRERIYKFYRFTWSKQFYNSINEHRNEIRELVVQILNSSSVLHKTKEINTKIWKTVWSKYQNHNLHYDATDQFVRNCVNCYLQKLSKQDISCSQKESIEKLANLQNKINSQQQSNVSESDSFSKDHAQQNKSKQGDENNDLNVLASFIKSY